MASPDTHRCARCRAGLARDNPGPYCSACGSAVVSEREQPHDVPALFWDHPLIREAVRDRHMGRLIAAYRHHPHHGTPITQGAVAGWAHLTQAQISRLERQPSERQPVERLIFWARLLRIPPPLLWFTLPDDTPAASGDHVQPAGAPAPSIYPTRLATRPDRPYVEGEPPTSNPTAEDDDPMRRRTLLAGLVGAVTSPHTAASPGAPSKAVDFTAVRGIDPAAPTLDDLERLAAVARDARRYADAALVTYLGDCLTRSAADDGVRGPRYALPEVLGIAAVVDHAARQARSNVRRPLLGVGARAAEFAGWLYRDCGQPAPADYWRDRASEWAMEATDFAMPGYVLLKKSQSAWDARDAARMLGLAQAVQEGPWHLPARVRAEAVQQEARGLAMHNRRRTEVDNTLKRANELLNVSAQDKTQLAAHYDAALFQLQTAICYNESGRPDEAVEIYDATLTPDVISARDIAYFSALKAQTLVAANRVDDAATTGAAALGGALATGSARTLQELARLGRRLGPWRSRSTVGGFLRLLQAA